MHIFLIILAVIIFLSVAIMSISATFTVIYDKNWKTTLKILWIEREIELTKLLSFVLFPEEAAKNRKNKQQDKKKNKEMPKANPIAEKVNSDEVLISISEKQIKNTDNVQQETQKQPVQKQQKQNYFKKIIDQDGIVGILIFISNLFETATSALLTLFRGFHIHSLYVKIITGGGDAAQIAQSYGRVCKYYYPVKGIILNGMKVDNYDDMIMPDFIAPCNEYGLQFIGSISVGLLLKVLFSAGKTFLVNLIKNK